jgi:hypothetical protein
MSNEIDSNTTLTDAQKTDDEDVDNSRNSMNRDNGNDEDGERMSDRLHDKLEQISKDPSLDLFIYKIKFTMFSLTVLMKDPHCDDGTKVIVTS